MPRDLHTYRKKRSPEGTPEPIGRSGEERPGAFVVQQHDARRRHWDLRLEIAGTLHSWAVPKGPSLSTEDKRLAVETEDHPVEYYDFEGVIPEGNYGAGAMIVWDRGLAVHHLDPEEGLRDGKLLFDLKGYKLRGLWTLVRTARAPNEWLLIKKPDEWASGETVEELSSRSVLSGLTTEELAAGDGRAAEVRARLDELGAPALAVDPGAVEPMLASAGGEPFTDPGWLFELKYDGYRVLAATDRAAGGGPRADVRLRYRSGRDATATYPDLVRALGSLPFSSLLVDGEVTVLDETGRPTFGLLQQRAQLTRRLDVERAAVRQPVTFYAFDLLAFEGRDLRPLPLAERKELLRRLLPPAGPVRFADHVEEQGEALFAAVRERGLEGLIAKRADSPYRAGRSPAWLKIRADQSAVLAVVGYTAPQGSRSGFGALHLAVREGDGYRYIGRAGSGFTDAQLRDLHRRLEPARRETPPCTGPLPEGPDHTWVEPELVAEVRFTEVTDEGLLRHPVFERLIADRRPEECTWESAGPAPEEPPEVPSDVLPDEPPEPPEPPPSAARETRPDVVVSRPEKVFWPAEGYTKGDLVAYYRAVAPRMLPFLRDRPLVMTRYPDGIDGKSFYQKNAPDFTPEWVRTEVVWSEGSDKETRYVVCDDEETLLWVANLGAILLHVWSSRIATLQNPDWCILDLDAKDATFGQVIEVARAIHDLAGEIGLPSAVKTSGGSGLHVLLPLARQLTHQQSKQLAELVARVVAGRLPKISSVARRPVARQGKVYIDFLQNGRDKLLVAPYTARPTPGAPVSTPLEWDEVREGLDPATFTIKTAPERFVGEAADPLRVVLEAKPDLVTALGRLAEQV